MLVVRDIVVPYNMRLTGHDPAHHGCATSGIQCLSWVLGCDFDLSRPHRAFARYILHSLPSSLTTHHRRRGPGPGTRAGVGGVRGATNRHWQVCVWITELCLCVRSCVPCSEGEGGLQRIVESVPTHAESFRVTPLYEVDLSAQTVNKQPWALGRSSAEWRWCRVVGGLRRRKSSPS